VEDLGEGWIAALPRVQYCELRGVPVSHFELQNMISYHEILIKQNSSLAPIQRNFQGLRENITRIFHVGSVENLNIRFEVGLQNNGFYLELVL
jgi:hypothetical protein